MGDHYAIYPCLIIIFLLTVIIIDNMVFHRIDLGRTLTWVSPQSSATVPRANISNPTDCSCHNQVNAVPGQRSVNIDNGKTSENPKSSSTENKSKSGNTDFVKQSTNIPGGLSDTFTSSTSSQRNSDFLVSDRPHNFRRPNQLIADYDPYVAAKVKELAARKAPGDDPELVKLARQMMDHPHTLTPKLSKGPRPTEQSTLIDSILKSMTGGKFIECGGYDGELASPTVFFERMRGWTGLLVEADPGYYTQLIGKQRNVYSINACLSPQPYFSEMPYTFSAYRHTGGQLGRLAESKLEATQGKVGTVPCFPTETLLLALNWTTVDFFSLDVEGFELPILKTIPWSRFNITTLAVEFIHGREGKQAYIDYMTAQGYSVVKEMHFFDVTFEIYIDDLILVKDRQKSLNKR